MEAAPRERVILFRLPATPLLTRVGSVGYDRGDNRETGDRRTMIVFDLEWNSGRYEKLYLNEILQISAVKVEGRAIVDTFNAYIHPKAHKRWSPAAEALPIVEACRASQLTFRGAMAAFDAWCGEDRLFGTWGVNDFQALTQNLQYWKVEFPLPETFLDLQAAFSQTVGAKDPMALRYAVEYCRIPDIFDFHDAQGDALYTALVAEWIDPADLEGARRVPGVVGRQRPSSGLPKGRGWKGPCQDPAQVRSNRGGRTAVCPTCGARTRVDTWYGRPDKGPWYAPFTCPQHGEFLLRLDLGVSTTGSLWGANQVLPMTEGNRSRLRTAQKAGELPCRGSRRKSHSRRRVRRKKPLKSGKPQGEGKPSAHGKKAE